MGQGIRRAMSRKSIDVGDALLSRAVYLLSMIVIMYVRFMLD